MPGETENQTPALVPPGPGVVVRMYNAGLGDCFLLAFRTDDGGVRHVLIDCGIHRSYPDGKNRLGLVLNDIAKACGGRLHAIAVTHEHDDHISGFFYGKDKFENKEIRVGELWLAWTEDPGNPVAQELLRNRRAGLKALASAVSLLEAGNPPAAKAIGELIGLDSLGAAKKENRDVLGIMRSWPEKKPERPGDYLTPGDKPFTIPGVSGVRCFVLGPPTDIRRIKKMDDGKETYTGFRPITEMSAFGAAAVIGAMDFTPGERAGTETISMGKREALEEFKRSCPFDEHAGLTEEEAKTGEYQKFFSERYGFVKEDEEKEWRRIENAWLSFAESLALSIGDKTNNTSLVLAFELSGTDPGRILLFAGDAQVGNWLSWQELSWPGAGKDGMVVTGKDLLQKTVLYKVGHHGSANATLSKNGLELMESPDLVAMIPVDQQFANDVVHWDHPGKQVLRKLTEKTSGRVIRSDRIPQPPPESPEKSGESWKRFLENIEYDTGPDKLWIQYTIRQPG